MSSGSALSQGMRLAPVGIGLFVIACSCSAPSVRRSYPEPTVGNLAARLERAREAMTSFRADTTMDYWIGDQRAKGEVLVMGALGAKLRFAALSPAGGSTMVEMACDGSSFVYVDYQNNCAVTGPCDQKSIAHFFRIELAPDDFIHLALGTPPIIGTNGKLTFVDGRERLELVSEVGTEKLTVDLSGGRLDVIDAELVGTDGKIQWSVSNADFVDVGGHRVPGKTRFKSPSQKQDLLVDWGDTENRAVNIDIAPERFVLVAPPGLPPCGLARE